MLVTLKIIIIEDFLRWVQDTDNTVLNLAMTIARIINTHFSVYNIQITILKLTASAVTMRTKPRTTVNAKVPKSQIKMVNFLPWVLDGAIPFTKSTNETVY